MLVTVALWGFFLGSGITSLAHSVLGEKFNRFDRQTVTARVQRYWIRSTDSLLHVWAALAAATLMLYSMEVPFLFWGIPLQNWFFHPIILALVCWVPSQSAWHEWRRSQIHAVA